MIVQMYKDKRSKDYYQNYRGIRFPMYSKVYDRINRITEPFVGEEQGRIIMGRVVR